jgi:hypothetical protein
MPTDAHRPGDGWAVDRAARRRAITGGARIARSVTCAATVDGRRGTVEVHGYRAIRLARRASILGTDLTLQAHTIDEPVVRRAKARLPAGR